MGKNYPNFEKLDILTLSESNAHSSLKCIPKFSVVDGVEGM